jgi:hypothetical protein
MKTKTGRKDSSGKSLWILSLYYPGILSKTVFRTDETVQGREQTRLPAEYKY